MTHYDTTQVRRAARGYSAFLPVKVPRRPMVKYHRSVWTRGCRGIPYRTLFCCAERQRNVVSGWTISNFCQPV